MKSSGAIRGKKRQARTDFVELDAVTLLAVLLKSGSLRPVHLQRLGYSKRTVMRRLRRLVDVGVLSKTEGIYGLSPELVAKVRGTTRGPEELDGLAGFLTKLTLVGDSKDGQARLITDRLFERMKVVSGSESTGKEGVTL
jgi:hypothetical protein